MAADGLGSARLPGSALSLPGPFVSVFAFVLSSYSGRVRFGQRSELCVPSSRVPAFGICEFRILIFSLAARPAPSRLLVSRRSPARRPWQQWPGCCHREKTASRDGRAHNRCCSRSRCRRQLSPLRLSPLSPRPETNSSRARSCCYRRPAFLCGL